MKFLSILLMLFSMFTNKASTPETNLFYLVKTPVLTDKPAPLLLLLHGYASNEADLFSFANALPSKYLVVSARAPLTVGSDAYAWYNVTFKDGKPVYNFDESEQSRLKIISFIETLKERYNIDSNEIYLCGFSQGAIMSYSVGLTRPDLIKGIAVMSGRMLEEIKYQAAPIDSLKKLKIFISHGSSDQTLPLQYAKDANAYLQSIGLLPSFKIYPDGHTISKPMLDDLVKWLN
jgi:phospholipase/carboxylesterase